jgi:hypothetical protein
MQVYFGLLAILAAVLGVGTYWVLYGGQGGLPALGKVENTSKNNQFPSKTVKRVDWTPDKSFAEYLSLQAEPILLINSVAATFPRDILAKFVRGGEEDLLAGFFRHSSFYFGPYYDDHRPFHSIPAIAGRVPYEVDVNVRKSDIGRVLNGKSPPFYHLSADPAAFGIEFNTTEMLSLYPQESSENVWVSMQGVVTPCHYDGYHNMYTQLSGSKSFVLLPPCEYTAPLRSTSYQMPSCSSS